MNDFQTINDVVNESVRNSSYYTVAISSCVFIAYTLIIKLIDYFKSKSKTKPLIEISKAMKEMADNLSKLNGVLDKTFKDTERKEITRCKQAIELGFSMFASKIGQRCENIIVHNNIDENKELVIENINKLVSTEYYKLYSILSSYEIDEVNVASKLKEHWIKDVSNSLIKIIYNKQDSIKRIRQLNDKLLLYVEDYSTFVNNKTFNT